MEAGDYVVVKMPEHGSEEEMKLFSALIIGGLSGFMIYMTVWVTLGPDLPMDPGDVGTYILLVLLIFFGGCGLSSYIVLHGARTTAKVWARGGLLGAAEWMIAGSLPFFYTGKMMMESAGQQDFGSVALAGGFLSTVGLGIAVFMALVCLIIYVIANRIDVEFKRELARFPCPQCGELIAEKATRCRFCGATIHAKA